MGWKFTFGALLLAACSQEPATSQSGAETRQQVLPARSDAFGRSQSQRTITCHELMGGLPSPEPTTYELAGKSLFSTSPRGERQLISSEGKLVHLSRTEDDEGTEDAFASHTLQGDVLTRTVLWQKVGQLPRTAFVERYDFNNQTIVEGETDEDECHHNVRPDGRTQEEAEWEAMSGTGRLEQAK